MSTFKKVISIVLCIAMLAGSFALVGDLIPKALADEASTTAGASSVQSYADLVKKYGQGDDGFIYFAAEYYEADGKLTDYYVNAGDTLTVRLFLKSNMYIGEGYYGVFFDNKFFDVKDLGPGSENYLDRNGYVSMFPAPKNAEHPMAIRNNPSHTATSINITNVGWIKNTCGLDTTYMAETDLVQSSTKTDTTTGDKIYDFTSDLWFFTYEVNVKPGLANGTTGLVSSDELFWASSINPATGKHDVRKQLRIPCLHTSQKTDASTTSQGLTMNLQMDNGYLDYFVRDIEQTFTIGANPNAGDKTTSYNISFVEDDAETVIKTESVEEKTDIPFPAAAEGQIGWIVLEEGIQKPGTFISSASEISKQASADAKIMRVNSNTLFNITITLDKNTSVNTELLPVGVTYDATANTLNIATPLLTEYDLANIPLDALSAKDKEATEFVISKSSGDSAYEGTKITLKDANGANGTTAGIKVTVNWKTATYEAKLYLNKEAYDSGEEALHTINVEAGKSLSSSGLGIDKLIADKQFVGWINAETGEPVGTKDLIALQYSFGKDMEFYADWSDYEHSITYMIRDYENGTGWKEFKRVYSENATSVSAADVNKIAGEIIDTLGGKDNAKLVAIVDDDYDAISKLSVEEQNAHTLSKVAQGSVIGAISYTGHIKAYIVTTISYSANWNIPAYDEATDTFSNDYTTTVTATATAPATNDTSSAYTALTKYGAAVVAPAGYAFAGWVDADGNAVETNATDYVTLSGLDAREVSYFATFEIVEYPVIFNLRNGAFEDKITLVGNVKLGEEINIDGAEFTLNGNASALPEIGVENEEQPEGGYKLPAGKIFAGWVFGWGATATEATFPTKLTAEMIRRNVNGAIQFNATYEAKEYALTFAITNAEGNEEIFSTFNVKVDENIAAYKEVTPEIAAAINAKAPTGQVFSLWRNAETNKPDAQTKMPAKDVKYYASYTAASLNVYINYNNLETEDLTQTLKRVPHLTSVKYGTDIDFAEEGNISVRQSVTRMIITAANRPDYDAAITSWNVYHVPAGKDVNDRNNWVNGVNDENSSIVTSTIIFEPKWTAYKDFFFRIVDNGPSNIPVVALGKNLKLYFWNSYAEPTTSIKDVVVNTKETMVILFYSITVENWNWDEFFNPDMWASITVEIKPAFEVSETFFTPKGFIEGIAGLGEVIKNLLGSLL